ncbi:hypothetical protein [Chryseobacterium schmidteae]|nr:hypothetical protein [Chryseobacterium schmidteae]
MENLEIIVQIFYAISLNYQLIEKVVMSICKNNKKEEEKTKT